MPLDAAEILVANTGHIYTAPVGTTGPSDATALMSAASTAWQELGYTTTDGVRITPANETGEVNGWQSIYTLRRWNASKSQEVGFDLLQFNTASLPLAFGGGTAVGTTSGSYAAPDASVLDERAFVIDITDGSRLHRIHYPKGLVTGVGEIKFSRDGAATLPLTMTPTLTAGTALFNWYWSDANFAAGTGL